VIEGLFFKTELLPLSNLLHQIKNGGVSMGMKTNKNTAWNSKSGVFVCLVIIRFPFI
jgi:hypothetical protein